MISKRKYQNLKNEVSVFILSYNFEKNIEQCLNSILSQVVSIPIKIYCTDDGSNDGTQEILKKYADKYKKIIKIILSNENTKNATNLLIKANIDCDSKYFSHFDGDDYWIDNYFLQKKIKILNRDEKIIGCSSITKRISENKIDFIKPDMTLFNMSDMVRRKNLRFYCHTSSILWKNYYYNEKTKLPFPKHFVGGKDGDTFFFHLMLNNGHYIYVIPEVLSVYRYTGKGTWSSLTEQKQNKLNKKLRIKILYYSALKYKFLFLISVIFSFYKFTTNKFVKLLFKFFIK